MEKVVQEVGIGRIVLYRIGIGPNEDRAMIVTKVYGAGLVNGILFLDGYNDFPGSLPGTNMGSSHVWINSCLRGNGLYQWRFYDDPE